jgi:hypothetical protein
MSPNNHEGADAPEAKLCSNISTKVTLIAQLNHINSRTNRIKFTVFSGVV